MSGPSFAAFCWDAMATCRDERWCPVRDDKEEGWSFIDANGWPRATTIAVARGDEIIDLLPTDRPCVLKPMNGAASIGVRALDPVASGWYDNVSGRFHSQAQLFDLVRLVARQHPSWDDRWLIEELLRSPHDGVALADEWKVYVFGGTVRLIQQRRHIGGPDRYRWYSRDWVPVTTGKLDRKIDQRLHPPVDPAGIRALAEEVASALPHLGFVRVDLFESVDGLRVGEVNGWIGDPSFNAEWDGRLGRWWQQALDRRTVHRLVSLPDPAVSRWEPAHVKYFRFGEAFERELRAYQELPARVRPRLLRVEEAPLPGFAGALTIEAGRPWPDGYADRQAIVDLLRAVHDAGWAHRDVHRYNIVFCDGQPRLIDWEHALPDIDRSRPPFDLFGPDVSGVPAVNPASAVYWSFGRPIGLSHLLGPHGLDPLDWR